MVYYTFVFPKMEQRREELSARLAVYSIAMARHKVAPLTPEAPMLPMCGGCGSATGSWCDACEARGLYFRFPEGHVAVGSPLCIQCENDGCCPICP